MAGAGGSTPMTRTSRWPRPMTYSAAARAPPGVVDLDRAVFRQGRRVHQDDGQAGAPDLLDLRVVVGQADGDHAVHGRPAHRPGQAAVQRRDEVQAVAELLGRDGDALAERPEERVREDDRQGLRGQDADRQGLALGEHPGDRVGPIAEFVGDGADAAGGLGRQPVRAVERERHGRLGDTRLARDVRDPWPAGPLFHTCSDCVGDGHPAGRPTPGRPQLRHRTEEERRRRRVANRFSKPV